MVDQEFPGRDLGVWQTCPQQQSLCPDSKNGRETAHNPRRRVRPPSPDEAEGWVEVSKAAAFLGLTEGALRQAVARRQFPFSKVGRRLRFNLAELDAQVRKGWVPPFDDGPAEGPHSEGRS